MPRPAVYLLTLVTVPLAAAADLAGGDSVLFAVLAVAALVAAAAASMLLVRRRRSRAFAAPLAPAPPVAVAGPPSGSDRLLFSRASPDQPRQRAGVSPPEPDRPWTAEIEWTRSGDTARFCVLARDEPGASETVLARSESFDWPPEGTEAVQALVAAADALSEALALAGWKPLPRGEAWYAKRFEWEPAPKAEWAPPLPGPSAAAVEPTRPPTNRFRPAADWPPGTEAFWRCTIRWRPGYARSRFEVVMHDPAGDVSDRVIAASAPFKWLLMGDPDPSEPGFREAALDLAAALAMAGWERVGVGAPWYAARFVWRRDAPPSDDILVAPARSRGGSR